MNSTPPRTPANENSCCLCEYWHSNPDNPEYGACMKAKRTDISGNTCYLETHYTSGTFCPKRKPLFKTDKP